MFFRRKRNKTFRLFVSIGAGFNQIPLIREAKKAGFSVIGIDKNSSAAGLLDCDIRIHESINNHSEIYQKIQELLLDGEVKGALTRSYGEAVKSTAVINDQLGRNFIPPSALDALLDKHKMKSIFAKNRICSPGYSIIKKASQIKSFPCVLKPLKGHAKQGVQYIADSSAASEYISCHTSDDETYLCENYIKGNEIIASGITVNGKFTLIEITDKETTRLPYFVDVRHSAPSIYYPQWDEIEKIGQQIAESFNIITSPLLFEARIDENNNIFVIEAIPEFGGEFLADVLIPEHTGYNFIRNAILALTGEPYALPVRRKYKGAVVVKYITSSRPGTLTSITPLQKHNRKKLCFTAIFKDIGANVSAPATNHDRIGVIVAKAKNIEDANAAILLTEKKYDIVIKEKRAK